MAHGNVNNSIKDFLMSFLKMSVQQPMKDRHMDIRQQMRLSKTLYKKGLSDETH